MSSSHPPLRLFDNEGDEDDDGVVASENDDLESSASTFFSNTDDEVEEVFEEEGGEAEEQEGEEEEEEVGEVEEQEQEETGDEEEEEEEGDEIDDSREHQEEDMDLLSDEEDTALPQLHRQHFPFPRLLQQQNRHQAPLNTHSQHVNTSSRSFSCLSCKEMYTSRRAGTCRECYDEASETEEALKKEIEELQARIAFLKTWAPEATEEECADIVLECFDGSKIRAHRAVLVSRSPVLKAMLQSKMEESRTNTIKITDFTYEVLRLFIHYLYTAEIEPEFLEDSASDLLALAEKYNVKQLKAVCERHMVSKLNSGNALSSFEYASLHGAKILKQAALSIVLEYIHAFMEKTEYRELVNRDAKLVVEIFEAYLIRQNQKASTQG